MIKKCSYLSEEFQPLPVGRKPLSFLKELEQRVTVEVFIAYPKHQSNDLKQRPSVCKRAHEGSPIRNRKLSHLAPGQWKRKKCRPSLPATLRPGNIDGMIDGSSCLSGVDVFSLGRSFKCDVGGFYILFLFLNVFNGLKSTATA